MKKISDQSINRMMNAKEFAALVGVTGRSVTDWCDEGMPCTRTERSGSPVTVDVRLAIKWLMRRRVEPAANQRIAVAKAERLEMMNLKARGEVLLASDVKQQVAKAIAFLNIALESVPARCAPLDESPRLAIEAELRRARNEFADGLESLAKSM